MEHFLCAVETLIFAWPTEVAELSGLPVSLWRVKMPGY